MTPRTFRCAEVRVTCKVCQTYFYSIVTWSLDDLPDLILSIKTSGSQGTRLNIIGHDHEIFASKHRQATGWRAKRFD